MEKFKITKRVCGQRTVVAVPMPLKLYNEISKLAKLARVSRVELIRRMVEHCLKDAEIIQ